MGAGLQSVLSKQMSFEEGNNSPCLRVMEVGQGIVGRGCQKLTVEKCALSLFSRLNSISLPWQPELGGASLVLRDGRAEAKYN